MEINDVKHYSNKNLISSETKSEEIKAYYGLLKVSGLDPSPCTRLRAVEPS